MEDGVPDLVAKLIEVNATVMQFGPDFTSRVRTDPVGALSDLLEIKKARLDQLKTEPGNVQAYWDLTAISSLLTEYKLKIGLHDEVIVSGEQAIKYADEVLRLADKESSAAYRFNARIVKIATLYQMSEAHFYQKNQRLANMHMTKAERMAPELRQFDSRATSPVVLNIFLDYALAAVQREQLQVAESVIRFVRSAIPNNNETYAPIVAILAVAEEITRETRRMQKQWAREQKRGARQR